MGRPRKNPLPEPIFTEEPIVISMGMEKIGKLYSAFIMKTSGDKVISKTNFQPDLKISSQMILHDQIIWAFVNNENF
jgi:hypothetical protein